MKKRDIESIMNEIKQLLAVEANGLPSLEDMKEAKKRVDYLRFKRNVDLDEMDIQRIENLIKTYSEYDPVESLILSPTIWSDPKVLREYIWFDDVVLNAICKLLERNYKRHWRSHVNVRIGGEGRKGTKNKKVNDRDDLVASAIKNPAYLKFTTTEIINELQRNPAFKKYSPSQLRRSINNFRAQHK